MFFNAQVRFSFKVLAEVRKVQIYGLRSIQHLQDDLQTAQGCVFFRTVQQAQPFRVREERDH